MSSENIRVPTEVVEEALAAANKADVKKEISRLPDAGFELLKLGRRPDARINRRA